MYILDKKYLQLKGKVPANFPLSKNIFYLRLRKFSLKGKKCHLKLLVF